MEFQVSIPYKKLVENDSFYIDRGLNPEIHFFWYDLDEPRFSDAEKLQKKLEEKKLRVTFHAPFIDLIMGHIDPLFKEAALKRLVSLKPFVEIFSPETVVVHGGYDPNRYDAKEEYWLEPARWFAERILKLYPETKVVVENTYEWDPGPIVKLLDEFQELFFCYDIAHAFIKGKVPLQDWLDALGDKTLEVHLSDNNGEFDDHIPMGEGLVEFAHMFRFFKKRGKEPIYTIEVFRDEIFFKAIEGFKEVYRESLEEW